jgi:hypothetical protein
MSMNLWGKASQRDKSWAVGGGSLGEWEVSVRREEGHPMSVQASYAKGVLTK